jgi:hypothetical protein
MRLILTPFHLRPLSAGTTRARLETEAEARPYHPPQAARRHSPPRRLVAARSAPASRAATEPQHRLYRPQNGSWWGLDAHSISAPRGGHAGGPEAAARVCSAVSIVMPSSSSGLKNCHYSSAKNTDWCLTLAGGVSRCSRSGLREMLSPGLANRIELRCRCAFG